MELETVESGTKSPVNRSTKRKLLTPDRGVSPSNEKLQCTEPASKSRIRLSKRTCLFGKEGNVEKEQSNAISMTVVDADDVRDELSTEDSRFQDKILSRLNIETKVQTFHGLLLFIFKKQFKSLERTTSKHSSNLDAILEYLFLSSN